MGWKPWRSVPGRKSHLNPANWDVGRAKGWVSGSNSFFGVGRYLSGVGQEVKKGINKTTYQLNKLVGTEEHTTIGHQKAEAKRNEIAAQEAAARKAAHDAEVAQLSRASLGSVAARRRRGPYGTLLTGTPSLSQGPTSGSQVLGY